MSKGAEMYSREKIVGVFESEEYRFGKWWRWELSGGEILGIDESVASLLFWNLVCRGIENYHWGVEMRLKILEFDLDISKVSNIVGIKDLCYQLRLLILVANLIN